MKLRDFYYDLPADLIAQYPLEKRDNARLLVLERKVGNLSHHWFHELPAFIVPGDVIVLNNTKVFKARIFGKKETGAKVEILIIAYDKNQCTALINPGRRIKDGDRIIFDRGISAVIIQKEKGRYYLDFNTPVSEFIDILGMVPLPHYIKRTPDRNDEVNYQTVYAAKTGSIAAPTAGLHFTEKVLADLQLAGAKIAEITLHVGPGTFKPIRSEDVEQHTMDLEYVEISQEAADIINAGKRIIGVGTSVTRALEHVAAKDTEKRPSMCAFSGCVDLFIYPGFRFRVINALITNFHLPCSTPLLLVCAFAGRELIFKSYNEAVSQKYRLLSYGDAMLIL